MLPTKYECDNQMSIFDYIEPKKAEEPKKVIGYCHATLDKCNREQLTWLAREQEMECTARCCAVCNERHKCPIHCWYSSKYDKTRERAEEEYFIEAIQRGSLVANGKKRISGFYSSGMNQSERVAAIKKEYGIGGYSGPLKADGLKGADFSANGMRVDYIYNGDGYAKMYSWKNVEECIHRLIDSGEYRREK